MLLSDMNKNSNQNGAPQMKAHFISISRASQMSAPPVFSFFLEPQ